MQRSLIRVLFSLGITAVAISAHGQVYSSATGNWEAGSTWVGGTPPTTGSNVVIRHEVTIGNVVINPTVNTITIENNSTTNARLTVFNNTLTVSNGIVINGQDFASAATLRISSNGKINVAAGGVTITRLQTTGAHCGILWDGDGELSVVGDFSYTYSKNSSNTESTTEIDITSSSANAFSVSGDLNIKSNEGGNAAGASSTNDVNLTISSGAVLNVSGKLSLTYNDVTSPSTNHDIIVTNNNSTIRINGALTFTDRNNNGLHNSVVCAGNAIARAAIVVAGDIIFTSNVGDYAGNKITIDDYATLEMKGNFQNHPSKGSFDFTGQESEAKFTGTGTIQQTIPGVIYKKLVINNTSNQRLRTATDNYVRVSVSLSMLSGIVEALGFGIVLEYTADSNEGSEVSYIINGMMKRGSKQTFLPIGAIGKWAPLWISNVAGAEDAVAVPTALVFNYQAVPYSNLAVNGSLDHVSGKEYWTIQHVAGTLTSFNLSMRWKNAGWSKINNVSTPGTLRVARYNASTSNWNAYGSPVIDAGSAADDGNSATGPETGGISVSVLSGSITAVTPFTFAATSNLDNPLPVEIKDFFSQVDQDETHLIWHTASEINNDYFVIERSNDGINFFEIGRVSGSLNSKEIIEYSFVDEYPMSGVNYYRLKQVDIDKAHSYSEVIMVVIDDLESDMSVYPTLVASEGEFTIFYRKQNLNEENSKVDLIPLNSNITFDAIPLCIYRQGKISVKVDPTLNRGVYVVRLFASGQIFQTKIVLVP